MRKGPAPTEWNVVDVALGGALLGILVGALFCCFQMVTSGAGLHIVRDSAIGGVVGVLVLGTFALIRNRVMRTRNFR
jgi:hypothetical protein